MNVATTRELDILQVRCLLASSGIGSSVAKEEVPKTSRAGGGGGKVDPLVRRQRVNGYTHRAISSEGFCYTLQLQF